jgi:hypothetical protein
MQAVKSLYKHIHTIPGFLLLVLLIANLVGCFGGGDDDEVDTDVPATVPDQLNYEIRQGDSVSLTIAVGQDARQAIVSSAFMTGTYNRITEAFTLDPLGPGIMTVSASDFLADLDTQLSNDIEETVNFSEYAMQIVESAAWVGKAEPTRGKFDIYDDEVRKITVTVNPSVNDSGIAGVDITYLPFGDATLPGQTGTVSVTWDQLDGLYEDTLAEPYARIASFAYSVMRFMYEQGDLVIRTLEYIAENDTRLEKEAMVAENCDTYPLAPVPTVSDPGDSTLNWVDVSLNNELGGGDSFFWIFNQCWNDDDMDNIDLLLDGKLDMLNYAESVTNGVITRIGFEAGDANPSGVVYDDLVLTETETTLANVILKVDEAVTLNGGFDMIFFTQ